MNFRLLLFPFAFVYFLITSIRNWMFDNGILKSTVFPFPVICIGNLTVGGTGKSPTTNYLLDLLHPHFKIAVLSRGYGRKTKGFILVNEKSTAEQIGDEPLMYFKRIGLGSLSKKGPGAEAQIAVCEDRVTGINTLKNKFNDLQVVLLDDAYQHRAVAAGLNILITDYANLYSEDYILPMGNLRESKAGASRAQIVVVSKCPEKLSDTEKKAIIDKLRKSENQHFFFSFMKYAALTNVLNPLLGEGESQREGAPLKEVGSSQFSVGNKIESEGEGESAAAPFSPDVSGRVSESNEVGSPQFSVSNKIESKSEAAPLNEVGSPQFSVGKESSNHLFSPFGGRGAALLITGIAKPKPLVDYLHLHFSEIVHLDFKDHHNFTTDDLSNARKKFDNIANDKKIIITTEKDWMRIQDGKLKIVFNDLPVYIQPIAFEFNSIEKQKFNNLILDYVRNNKTNG